MPGVFLCAVCCSRSFLSVGLAGAWLVLPPLEAASQHCYGSGDLGTATHPIMISRSWTPPGNRKLQPAWPRGGLLHELVTCVLCVLPAGGNFSRQFVRTLAGFIPVVVCSAGVAACCASGTTSVSMITSRWQQQMPLPHLCCPFTFLTPGSMARQACLGAALQLDVLDARHCSGKQKGP